MSDQPLSLLSDDFLPGYEHVTARKFLCKGAGILKAGCTANRENRWISYQYWLFWRMAQTLPPPNTHTSPHPTSYSAVRSEVWHPSSLKSRKPVSAATVSGRTASSSMTCNLGDFLQRDMPKKTSLLNNIIGMLRATLSVAPEMQNEMREK